MKKNILLVALTTVFVSTQLNAAGAIYFAMKGPSIPKVMKEGQVFEKVDKLDRSIVSDNNSVVSIIIEPKDFSVRAHKPGKANLIVTKKNKIKVHATVIVAYNDLNEIPQFAQVKTKIFLVAGDRKNENLLTCSDKSIRIVRQKIGNEYFYEIQFKKTGTAELKQNGHVRKIHIGEKALDKNVVKTVKKHIHKKKSQQ